jgi:hypothetical protein
MLKLNTPSGTVKQNTADPTGVAVGTAGAAEAAGARASTEMTIASAASAEEIFLGMTTILGRATVKPDQTTTLLSNASGDNGL